MRVSTSMTFDLGATSLNRQQGEMLRVQQQLATGKRVLSAADDPGAAARAVEISSAAARNTQYASNQTAATASLSSMETTLSSFADELENVRQLLIQAGSGANSDQERANIAADLEARNTYLLSLANARDANGAFIFAGFQEGVQPFQQGASSVNFVGDSGFRQLPVSEGRTLPVSASGGVIFDQIAQGNGVFETSAPATNAGSGVIDGGVVTDATQLTGHAYQIKFNVTPLSSTYDIIDTTTGTPVSAGNSYVPGASVAIAGMRMQISGAPVNGDSFDVTPATKKSVFNVIADVVKLLRVPAQSAAAKAQLNMGTGQAVQGIDRSLDAVMLARSAVGAGLREVDTLKNFNDGRALEYKTELSNLLDVDYSQAVTELTRLQAVTGATQKAFISTVNRSLFDML